MTPVLLERIHMGDPIKTLLSASIKVLEQGAFQEFNLLFLPLFHSRFACLERHGGTADGKTRSGTPDLIVTNTDGSTLCVQCSVDKTYWTKPAKINEWKPIDDIIKCEGDLPNIKEIVLCASQEIPTNSARVKSDIKSCAKEYTNAEITILSISNYEEETRNDTLKYMEVIKRFCQDLYKILSKENKHTELLESLDGLQRKIDELSEKNNFAETNVQVDKAKQPIVPVKQIHKPQENRRVTNFLATELEDSLEKLNIFFKSEADGIKDIQKGRNYGRAIERYESLLSKADTKIDDETIIGIYADCALCSINIDDIESANDWLCKAEKIETNDKRIHAIRGFYYYELGNKEIAKKYADNALIIDTFYHLALVLKTGIELEEGTNGKRILYKYFLDKEGNLKTGFKQEHMPVIYRSIGQCYALDNELNDAIEYFERSLALDPLDDGTCSLVGTAYLNKALGDNTQLIDFNEQLSTEEEKLVRKAIGSFSKALELAARCNNIKRHISTSANLSMCYMLLGEYDEAYDISGVPGTSITEYESLLKSKAAAAYYKGFFSEAVELLSKIQNITCQDITHKVLALLHSDKEDKENEALALIEDSLSNESYKIEDLDFLRNLKFEILYSLKDIKRTEEVLRELEISTLPDWQKEKARGGYCELMNDNEGADKHYKMVLKHVDITISVKIVIADYYYKIEDYKTCFNICSTIPIESIKSSVFTFKFLFHILIVSSFNISKLDKCREYVAYGKQQGIEDSYLNEISASFYWQDDELEMARDELSVLLDLEANVKNHILFSNYALVSFMLGEFGIAKEYVSLSEKISGFYDNTDIVRNCIVILTVIGDKPEAKRILKKALNIKFEDKDDNIHKFAGGFYLRENNANLFTEYAIEFNKKHGDTEWLWKKDIKKVEEELRTIFSERIRYSVEIIKNYLRSPLPLVFLPSLLWKREIIHLWRFNREYGLPIFLESGNHKELKSEVSVLSKNKSILIDYTALLTLQEAGMEYLWLLDNNFDEIFIYRPMYLQMLNELMSEEHDGLRQIINFISKSKKIKFIKKVKVKKLNIQDKDFSKIIQEEYCGLFQVAKGNRMILLLGESRLRGFARGLGIESCGIRSLLEYAEQNDTIDNHDKQTAISNWIKKGCQFVSFNRGTLEYIYTQYSREESKTIFKRLSDQIFLSGSQIETFMKVYCEFINKNICIVSDSQIIKNFIEKTISDIKILTFRARVFYIYPLLNRDNVLTDIDKITLISVHYIYLLSLTIYASAIDEALRSEYIEVIKKEANLAFWAATSEFNSKSLIRRILEKAKQESVKKRVA